MHIGCIKKKFVHTVAVRDLIQHRFSMIVFSEAWLKDSFNIPGITGYSSHSTKKNYIQNDGVVIKLFVANTQ